MRYSSGVLKRHEEDDFAYGVTGCMGNDGDAGVSLVASSVGGELPFSEGDVCGEGKAVDEADFDAAPLRKAVGASVGGLGECQEKKEPEKQSEGRHACPLQRDHFAIGEDRGR